MKFRTRKKGGLLINLVLVFLAASAVASFYFAFHLGYPEFDMTIFVLIGSGLLWSAVLAAMYLQSYAWYTGYTLQKDALYLRGVYGKKLIDYHEIAEIEILEADEAADFIEKYQKEVYQNEANMDLKSWYRSNKQYAEVLKFSSVQFTHSKTTTGNEMNVTGGKTFKAGRFVRLSLNNDQAYLLSPEDPERFSFTLKQKTGIPLDLQ
jgi:hypothetical protein